MPGKIWRDFVAGILNSNCDRDHTLL